MNAAKAITSRHPIRYAILSSKPARKSHASKAISGSAGSLTYVAVMLIAIPVVLLWKLLTLAVAVKI